MELDNLIYSVGGGVPLIVLVLVGIAILVLTIMWIFLPLYIKRIRDGIQELINLQKSQLRNIRNINERLNEVIDKYENHVDSKKLDNH